MSTKLPVSSGDFLRAMSRLEARDEQTVQRIARLMGFTVTGPRRPESLPEANLPWSMDTAGQHSVGSAGKDDDVESHEPGTLQTAAGTATEDGDLVSGQAPGGKPDRLLLRFVRQDIGSPPEWVANVPALQPESDSPGKTPLLPLLTPRWSRAVLTSALSRMRTTGAIDLHALLTIVTRQQVAVRLPRLRRRALAAQVQVLLDRSEAMMPFYADQSALLPQLRRLVGAERLRTGSFVNARQLLSWQDRLCRSTGPTKELLSSHDSVILLLSDVGIGRPLFAEDWISEATWLTFARAARSHDVPVVVLVPFRETRWPQQLRDEMTLLRWDRGTAIGQILRALRRAEHGKRG